MSTTPASASAPAASAAPGRPLLMIPGPIEFHPAVLARLGEPTVSHVSGGFMEEFGSALASLRTVLQSGPHSQPFILSGSGTLGWEIVAANLLEGQNAEAGASNADAPDVLVVNTGYFSDSWADCFATFGLAVKSVAAPAIGATVAPEAVVEALQANPSIRMVALTQVDTSTGVRNDIAALSGAVKRVRPDVLVAVDGVCSFGGEQFQMQAWGVDAALTCSQKALGVPPGLCILMLSSNALKIVTERNTRVPVYYGNLQRWLPIMRAYEARTPSYFATPPVNLIRALKVALDQIIGGPGGVEGRWKRHTQVAAAFKAAITAMGLKQVPTGAAHNANTLSCVYFPTGTGVNASKILPSLVSSGVVCAGGLHKEIKATYFRVGHMGYSVMEPGREDVMRVVQALEKALTEAGVSVTPGAGVKAFQEVMQQA